MARTATECCPPSCSRSSMIADRGSAAGLPTGRAGRAPKPRVLAEGVARPARDSPAHAPSCKSNTPSHSWRSRRADPLISGRCRDPDGRGRPLLLVECGPRPPARFLCWRLARRREQGRSDLQQAPAALASFNLSSITSGPRLLLQTRSARRWTDRGTPAAGHIRARGRKGPACRRLATGPERGHRTIRHHRHDRAALVVLWHAARPWDPINGRRLPWMNEAGDAGDGGASAPRTPRAPILCQVPVVYGEDATPVGPAVH